MAPPVRILTITFCKYATLMPYRTSNIQHIRLILVIAGYGKDIDLQIIPCLSLQFFLLIMDNTGVQPLALLVLLH
jgi:hypothetical protein